MDLSGNYVKVATDLIDVSASNDATYTYRNWDELSDSDGYFENLNPVLEISFTTTHSSYGFDLPGSNIESVKVDWYGEGNEIIHTEYVSSSSRGTRLQRIDTIVLNYKKIRIEVRRITGSEERVTLVSENFIYGIQNYVWSSDVITQASIVENTDITSNQLPSGQFTFSIIDPDDEFNLGNPNGFHHLIQPGQIVVPIEYFSDYSNSMYSTKTKQMGIYFIESFSIENNLVKFNCIDGISMLDKYQYITGLMYDDGYYNFSSVGTIVDEIFSLLPYTGSLYRFIYIIDSDIRNIHLHGTIKPMTGRQALREVIFACGAVCLPLRDYTNRNGGIRITSIDRTIKYQLTKSQKINTKVSKLDYVSAVTIDYTTYEPESEPKDIETATYPAGENLIIFSSPYKNVTISSGTIIESLPFYVKFTLTTNEEVTISGIPYRSETKSITAKRLISSGQDGKNELKFSSQLCDNAMAIQKANQLLEYKALRLQVDTQYISDDDIQIGDFVIIQNPNESMDDYLAGVETLTIDLSGGFVSTAKLIGFFNYAFSFYRAGQELYTNDNIII